MKCEANFYMFTAAMSPMKRGRVEKALAQRVRNNGVVMSYADYVASALRESYRPKCYEVKAPSTGSTKVVYSLSNGKYSRSPFNKTMYDFAVYLVDCGAVTEEEQAKLRAQETEMVAAAQHMAQEEQARIQLERQQASENKHAFKEWIAEQKAKYACDPRVAIVVDVMVKMYGEDYPQAYCAELLVLFDNLHDDRVRNRLKETLHPMNKGSRKAFQAITGLKLPAGVKATQQYITSLGGVAA